MLLRLSPDQVSRYWIDIKEAVMAAVPPLGEATPAAMNNLLENLLRKRLDAWIIYEKKDEQTKIYAVMVTTVWVDLGTRAKNLHIYALYGYSFIPDELWKESLDKLKAFAKRLECQKIVAFTSVERMKHVAEQIGADLSVTLVQLEV